MSAAWPLRAAKGRTGTWGFQTPLLVCLVVAGCGSAELRRSREPRLAEARRREQRARQVSKTTQAVSRETDVPLADSINHGDARRYAAASPAGEMAHGDSADKALAPQGARGEADGAARLDPPEKAVGPLVKLLAEGGYRLRPHDDPEGIGRRTVAALAEIGAPSVGPLAALLRDEGRETCARVPAALVLGEVGGREAERELAAALRSGDQAVRCEAALGLAKIGTPGAIEALIQALADATEPGYEGIVRALPTAGKPAIPPLLRALEHDSASVRYGAATALAKLGDLAEPALMQAHARGGPRVRQGAATALRAAQDRERREANENDRDVRFHRASGPDPRIMARDPTSGASTSLYRAHDARAAGRRRDPRFLGEMMSVVSDGQDLLHVRRVAAEALGDIGLAAQGALPLLDARAADREEKEPLRSAAGAAAERIRREAAEATEEERVWTLCVLLRIADDDLELEHVRPVAAAAVRHLGPVAHLAIPALRRIAEARNVSVELETAARQAALGIKEQTRPLSGAEQGRVVSELRRILEAKLHYDPVARVAAEMLGNAGAPAQAALPLLERIAQIPASRHQYLRKSLRSAAEEAAAKIQEALQQQKERPGS